jgi:alpha-amylase/alpha-mannosidase (GH57 family)
MRYFSLVLHFYQPPTQELGITRQILHACYLPVLRLLDQKSGFGLTLNLSGSLLLQLQKMDSGEFFDLIKKLLKDGKIELLNSPVYHPIIPLTPSDVVLRQIDRNQRLLDEIFSLKTLDGFFPPELALDPSGLDLINSQYLFIDQSSLDVKTPFAKLGNKYLLVNNHPVCELLRSYPRELAASTVLDLIGKNCPDGGLLVTVADVELFGHHYVERLQVLSDLLDSNDIKFVTASQVVSQFGPTATDISGIIPSSWQNCQKFSLWDKNDLQKEYLKLLATGHDLTLDSRVYQADDFLDKSFSSCYLYWLSNWPWWHPQIVQSGADCLVTSVRMSPVANQAKADVEVVYHNFLSRMWRYQWSGEVEIKYHEYDQQILASRGS